MNLHPSSVNSNTPTGTPGEPVNESANNVQPAGEAFSMSCVAAVAADQPSVRPSPDAGVSEQATTSGVVDFSKAVVPGDDEQHQHQPLAPDETSSNSDSDLEADGITSEIWTCEQQLHNNALECWYHRYDQDFLDNYQLTGEYKLNLHELSHITSEESRIKEQEERFIAGDYGGDCNRKWARLCIKREKQLHELAMKAAELEVKYQQRFSEKDKIYLIKCTSNEYCRVRLKPEAVRKLLDEDPAIFDGLKSPHILLPDSSDHYHPLAARYQPLARLIANNSDDQSMIFEIPKRSPSCAVQTLDSSDESSDESSEALPEVLTYCSVSSIPFPAYMKQFYKVNSHDSFQWVDFKRAEYELDTKKTREKMFLDNFYHFLFGVEDSATSMMVESAASNTLTDEKEETDLARLKAKFALLRNTYPPHYDESFTMDKWMDNFSLLFKGPSRE